MVQLSLKNFLAGDFNRASKELIFESLDNALFVIDQDQTIIELNQAAAGVIGRDRRELLGNGLLEYLPELSRKTTYNTDLGSNQKSLLEKDGKTFEVSLTPIHDGTQQVLGTVVSLSNITNSIQQAADLNTILQTAQEVSSSLDLNQVLVHFGERALEISGSHNCLISEWDKENNCVNVLVDLSRSTFARVGGERYHLKVYPTTERVLRTGKSLRVATDDSDPENTWMEELGLHQLLLLPLFHKEQIIGVVEMGRTAAGSPFSEDEEEKIIRLIQEAASWVLATHLERQGEDLMGLASKISQTAAMDLCTISEWIPDEGTIVSVAEVAYLSWDLGEGPKNDLAEWPSIALALESGEITHSCRSDLDPSQVEYEDLLKWGAKCRTVIPLTYQGNRTGVIELFNTLEEVQIEESKLKLLGGIAEHASIAIQNARLHVETQKQLSQQTILKEAVTVISSSLELQNVLDKLTEQLARVIDATSAYIVTYDLDQRTSMVAAEFFGEGASPQERKSDFGIPYQVESAWFKKLEQGMEHVISHHDDPEQWDSEKQHMHQFGAKSILYIPIRFMGNALGHAELWESRRKRQFNKDEISLCQAISQQAGSAIERAMLFEQSQFDATHDALTSLPNRTLLIDRLSQAILRTNRREHYKFALLYLDLDDFKQINDSLGHLAGDEFLVEIANRLAASTRQMDTVSRFGGDEFAILLEDIQDFSSVIQTVERIQNAISRSANIQGTEVAISSSIGIVFSSPEYANPVEYLRDVDIAMYSAKDQGKSRYEVFNNGSYLYEVQS
jgi:diguanylate cyclase (GGDEF)-like protein/PAS domain S-box-containing protein